MTFVHKEQKILGEIIQQRHGRGAGRASGDHPGIVLYAAAKADLLQHFDVVHGSLADALRFQKLVVRFEPTLALFHFLLDLEDGAVQLFARGDIVRSGVDCNMADHAFRHTGNGVDLGDAVDLVTEELHADGASGPVGGVDFYGVAADTEVVAGKIDVVALVTDIDELFHQLFARFFHAGAQ